MTRDPSGRRASTIGTDSSILLPIGAIILSIMVLTCSFEINFLLVNSILPFLSIYISSLLLTIISVISVIAKRSSSGPYPKASSRISFTSFFRTSREEIKLPASSTRKLLTIISALLLKFCAFLESLKTFKSNLLILSSSISRLCIFLLRIIISSTFSSLAASSAIKGSVSPCSSHNFPGFSSANCCTRSWSIS